MKTHAADYTKKDPRPTPTWVRTFVDAVTTERFDAVQPSRRAMLVATELLADCVSVNKATYIHRFAAALDETPMRLYELERQVSPQGPVELISDALAQRVDRAIKGLS